MTQRAADLTLRAIIVLFDDRALQRRDVHIVASGFEQLRLARVLSIR